MTHDDIPCDIGIFTYPEPIPWYIGMTHDDVPRETGIRPQNGKVGPAVFAQPSQNIFHGPFTDHILFFFQFLSFLVYLFMPP